MRLGRMPLHMVRKARDFRLLGFLAVALHSARILRRQPLEISLWNLLSTHHHRTVPFRLCRPQCFSKLVAAVEVEISHTVLLQSFFAKRRPLSEAYSRLPRFAALCSDILIAIACFRDFTSGPFLLPEWSFPLANFFITSSAGIGFTCAGSRMQGSSDVCSSSQAPADARAPLPELEHLACCPPYGPHP